MGFQTFEFSLIKILFCINISNDIALIKFASFDASKRIRYKSNEFNWNKRANIRYATKSSLTSVMSKYLFITDYFSIKQPVFSLIMLLILSNLFFSLNWIYYLRWKLQKMYLHLDTRKPHLYRFIKSKINWN